MPLFIMVKRVKLFYQMPSGGGYVVREGVFKTRATQNAKGRLTGRTDVRGQGDKTGVMRVEKPFVVVKKSEIARGHVRTIRQRYDSGQILGRF